MEDSDTDKSKSGDQKPNVLKGDSDHSDNMEIVDGDKVLAEKEAKSKDYKNR